MATSSMRHILPRLTQYHRLVDALTGDERIVRGPRAYAPEPLENFVPDCIQTTFVDLHGFAVLYARQSDWCVPGFVRSLITYNII